jgi:hypothetical protein
MIERAKNLVIPIPTRNTAQEHSSLAVDKDAGETVPTRGPLLQWVSRSDTASGDARQLPPTLIEMVAGLRKHVMNLPLTIIVHGWGDERAKKFLDIITKPRKKRDALWLVATESGGEQSPDAVTSIEGSVLLNLRQPDDRKVYSNLMSDIVFFPAVSESELQQAREFKHRTQAMVIDGNGRFSRLFLNIPDDEGLMFCVWSKDGILSHCDEFKASPVSTPRGGLQESFDIDKVGEELKEQIDYLDNEYARRLKLRARINEIIEQFPGKSDWSEDLIMQAIKYDWPSWALECLPKLYVPIGGKSKGGKVAFVWRQILVCAPPKMKYERMSELCNGEVFKIKMSPKAEKVIAEISRIFEESLTTFPFANEQSFQNGAINNALQDVEDYLRPIDLATSQRVRQMRVELLQRSNIIP